MDRLCLHYLVCVFRLCALLALLIICLTPFIIIENPACTTQKEPLAQLECMEAQLQRMTKWIMATAIVGLVATVLTGIGQRYE
jgi:hypothetical protein